MNTKIVKAKKLSLAQKKKQIDTLSYKEMLLRHTPDICFGISFVEHGYQADIWVNQGKNQEYLCGSRCRNFGGSYKVQMLTEEFHKELLEFIDKFTKNK